MEVANRKNNLPWFHYSLYDDGVYCQACALFAPKQVGGQHLGQFVTKPFKSWGKILQKASANGTKSYHLSSMTRMTEFLARYENLDRSISVIMDSELQRVMETNQKVLESLIKNGLLSGKQGLALRGHRDDKAVGQRTMMYIPMKVTLWNWYDFELKQTLYLPTTLLIIHEMNRTLQKRFKTK